MGDPVVVGVDGSDNAWRALEWAAGEAKVRGTSLKIVCAFEDPVAMGGVGTAFGAGSPVSVDPSMIEEAAKEVVDEATKRVDGVPVEVVARCERPIDALVEASQGAAMLVVGTRGHGRVGSLLLGSVSNYVVHHASCPVVIVPHAT
jgi:nucleotide-binding universal stress UspA family protein